MKRKHKKITSKSAEVNSPVETIYDPPAVTALDRKVDSLIKDFNEIGKNSWLFTSCRRANFTPARDTDGTPFGRGPYNKMNRFIFQADGGTSLDGEICPDGYGFTILSNNHQFNRYPEDAAFSGVQWKIGAFIPWNLFALALAYHVELVTWRTKESYCNSPVESVLARHPNIRKS